MMNVQDRGQKLKEDGKGSLWGLFGDGWFISYFLQNLLLARNLSSPAQGAYYHCKNPVLSHHPLHSYFKFAKTAQITHRGGRTITHQTSVPAFSLSSGQNKPSSLVPIPLFLYRTLKRPVHLFLTPCMLNKQHFSQQFTINFQKTHFQLLFPAIRTQILESTVPANQRRFTPVFLFFSPLFPQQIVLRFFQKQLNALSSTTKIENEPFPRKAKRLFPVGALSCVSSVPLHGFTAVAVESAAPLGDNFIPGKLQCYAKRDSPGMLGPSHAVELEVVGALPALLKSASFGRSDGVWSKGRPAALPPADQLSKTYEYTKLGRLLGMATTRFLALGADTLFYFDDADSEECLGYCPLRNTYLQWQELTDGRFLLVVSNGETASHFYFSSASFWEEQRTVLARSAVLLNFHQDFEVLQELGEGSFARVFRVRQLKTGEEYAAKMVSKADASPACIAMLAEERRILASFQDSPYIYQFREFHQTNEQYILLMEYLPGVDLMSFIRMQLELSSAERKYLLSNILMGLRECHQSSVIHRDLKPQNIIVDVHTYQLKIIDFGLSLQVEKRGIEAARSKCGTVGYMAPEIFLKKYSEKCDMYSFGIIAHLILMGSNPLKGKNYEETSLRNQAGKATLNQPLIIENYGENCLHFLRRCLTPQPEDRYSAEQALQSPFLQSSSKRSSVTTDDDRLVLACFD